MSTSLKTVVGAFLQLCMIKLKPELCMHAHNLNGSVCIVGDDDQVRRFLREVFASLGLKVNEFASGEQLVRCWRPDGPTCVLLDVRMPKVTGPEVHEWLR